MRPQFALLVLLIACKPESSAPEVAPSASEAPDVAAESAAPVASAETPAPSASASARFGVKGPSDNPDPHIARQQALKDAAEYGMIGLLNSGAGGTPSPVFSALPRSNMWGDEIGDAYGAGGLGLKGIGEGGLGGRGDGIGLGNIGTIGRQGGGAADASGLGSGGLGRLGSSRRISPSVRMGQTETVGSLPKEVIQRIVRQNFGRFRLCYENGLRNDPKLAGKVTVSFTIGTDGSVSGVKDTTDMSDKGVSSCVGKAFYGMSFPQPEKGVVKVSYPIMFKPGEGADSATPSDATKPEAKIGGTPLSKVTPADVEKVLRESGFTDVTTTEKPDQKGIFSISAKKGQEIYMITLVTAASGATLSDTEKARLSKDAAMETVGGFTLAVEAGDKANARALLVALIKHPD